MLTMLIPGVVLFVGFVVGFILGLAIGWSFFDFIHKVQSPTRFRKRGRGDERRMV